MMDSEEWKESAIIVAPPLKPDKTWCERRWRPNFGLVLAILVALATVSGSLAIGLLFWRALQDGNAALVKDLDAATLTTVSEQLVLASAIPRIAITQANSFLVNEMLFGGNILSLSNDQLRRVLFAASLSNFDGVLVGLADGSIIGYSGPMVAPFTFFNTTNTTTHQVSIYRTDLLGRPVQLQRVVQPLDVRTRPWFQVAQSVQRLPGSQVNWTNPEVLRNCECQGIYASRPITLGSRFAGAIASTLRLETLSGRLNATLIGKTGEAFLLDRIGNLVGLSDPQRLNFSFTSALVPAENITDPTFRDLISYLMSLSNSSFDKIPVIQPPVFRTLNGIVYIVSSLRVAEVTGLNWTAVIIVPRSDYFSVSDEAATLALIAGALAVVGVVVITVITSMVLLSIPLLRLAKGMDYAAKSLEVPPLQPRRPSFIDEVARMEQAYSNMAHGVYSFGKYVPRPVVKALVQEAQEPRVSVTSRECTFFFSDIADFTRVAESVDEQLLNTIITEYFAEMERILFELDGITTDFLGDGVFVFWNAPIPREDHALVACEAALRQQTCLEQLRVKWNERGWPMLYCRMGINTGPCLVGSFGSPNHLKYTVLGDAVNVASRLEQLNKFFATRIIVGHRTWEMVHHAFLARPLQVVVLKGKQAPTKVYELLARAPDATPHQRWFVHRNTAMLDEYMQRNFPKARAIACEILEEFPEDVPAALMRDKCTELINMPPDETWTPIYRLAEK